MGIRMAHGRRDGLSRFLQHGKVGEARLAQYVHGCELTQGTVLFFCAHAEKTLALEYP